MKVCVDAVDIQKIEEAISMAKEVSKIVEAQKIVGTPGVMGALHIQLEGYQPISIQMQQELLDNVLTFMLNREMTALNRMGVDLKE